MTYLLFKTLHLFAVILWIGSLFTVSYITSNSTFEKEHMRSATRITDASIGITWITGFVMVIMGSWYASTWWKLKVVIVVFISAIHSILHRRWRKAGSEGAYTYPAVPLVILILTLAVVFLVVFKRPL